jgi:type VI secretion system secreted protein VgrG
MSTTENIEIWAKNEITIGAGGSAIKINGSGITDMTSGQRIIHQSEFSLTSAKAMPFTMPTLPKAICLECLMKRATSRSAFMNKGTQ